MSCSSQSPRSPREWRSSAAWQSGSTRRSWRRFFAPAAGMFGTSNGRSTACWISAFPIRRQQPVVKVARPLLAASGRALRCRDLPVFRCNTAASRRLDPSPNPRRIASRDFNHGPPQLYRRLCRHYFAIDPAATAFYIHTYREMWDSTTQNGNAQRDGSKSFVVKRSTLAPAPSA
jgi:hypothetical protein